MTMPETVIESMIQRGTEVASRKADLEHKIVQLNKQLTSAQTRLDAATVELTAIADQLDEVAPNRIVRDVQIGDGRIVRAKQQVQNWAEFFQPPRIKPDRGR